MGASIRPGFALTDLIEVVVAGLLFALVLPLLVTVRESGRDALCRAYLSR